MALCGFILLTMTTMLHDSSDAHACIDQANPMRDRFFSMCQRSEDLRWRIFDFHRMLVRGSSREKLEQDLKQCADLQANSSIL